MPLIAALAAVLEGRYILGDPLGSGRGGVVVRAEHVASGRAVALKVAWNDPAARERVRREMTLTSEVKDLHVMPMRPVEATDEMLVVEMPFAQHGTVANLLDARTPVPYTRAVDIIRAAASALGQAHSAGIVHGALSPEKILFDDAGHVLVTDFALQIPPVAGRNIPRLSAIANPAYSALEVRHELPTTGARADQYSLAIVAYELLRGERTWRVNEKGVLEIAPIEINVSRPITSDAPLSAGAAIKRATAREPGYRYDSIASFVRAFAGDDSLTVSHAHSEPKPTDRRRRSMLRLLVASAIVLIVAFAVLPWTLDVISGWSGDDSGAATGGAIAVTIDGNRRAIVLIDGLPRGMTPLVWKGEPGRHTVRLIGLSRFRPSSISVDAVEGATVNAPFGVARR